MIGVRGIGVLAAAVALVGSGVAFGAQTGGASSTLSLAAGDSATVSCAGPQLRTAADSATALTLTCDPQPTTTTTAPPETTTAPPATDPLPTTTTTQPPSTTTTPPVVVPPVPTDCQFRSAPVGTHAALCQTFDDKGAGVGRSPRLSPLWGVSREFGNTNRGQGFFNAAIPTQLDACGAVLSVQPPDDVQVCDGMLVEGVTDGVGADNGTVTDLALYPKQPFDFADRTGTISFDVSDDSAGPHRAWPELWVTSSPAPAPFTHFSSLQTVPQDGFGIRFAGCGAGGNVVGVDSAVVVNNFVSNDSFAGDFPNGSINVQTFGCMGASAGVGSMNHVEVRVSKNVIDVFGTNAGDVGGKLVHLSHITGFDLPLTRGLVWLEDVHYNGNKDGLAPADHPQGTHTFSWDNVGFDGPVVARDLASDAPDNTAKASNGWTNLGYPMPAAVTVPDVVVPSSATSAAVLFNYSANNRVAPSVSVNGGPVHPVPANDPLCYDANNFLQCSVKTVKVDVDLSDIVPGNNVVHFTGSGVDYVSNVDIVLPGAG